MLRKQFVFTALVLMMLMSMMPGRRQIEAAAPNLTQPIAGSPVAENKFVGHWVSQITYASGEKIDDGVIDIADANPFRTDAVSAFGG